MSRARSARWLPSSAALLEVAHVVGDARDAQEAALLVEDALNDLGHGAEPLGEEVLEMAGSMSPERVPMTRPSSGVRPMVVSTDLPLSMPPPSSRCPGGR